MSTITENRFAYEGAEQSRLTEFPTISAACIDVSKRRITLPEFTYEAYLTSGAL